MLTSDEAFPYYTGREDVVFYGKLGYGVLKVVQGYECYSCINDHRFAIYPICLETGKPFSLCQYFVHLTDYDSYEHY